MRVGRWHRDPRGDSRSGGPGGACARCVRRMRGVPTVEPRGSRQDLSRRWRQHANRVSRGRTSDGDRASAARWRRKLAGGSATRRAADPRHRAREPVTKAPWRNPRDRRARPPDAPLAPGAPHPSGGRGSARVGAGDAVRRRNCWSGVGDPRSGRIRGWRRHLRSGDDRRARYGTLATGGRRVGREVTARTGEDAVGNLDSC
jgi:hypothetical protein